MEMRFGVLGTVSLLSYEGIWTERDCLSVAAPIDLQTTLLNYNLRVVSTGLEINVLPQMFFRDPDPGFGSLQKSQCLAVGLQ